MTMQKVGYDGTYLMELANTGSPAAVLEQAPRRARAVRQADGVLTMSSDRLHRRHRQSRGPAVRLRGWLHNRRSSGKIHFLTLRDGSGFIQCVMSKQAVGDEMFKTADHLAQESAIIVDGTARADARAPGGFEVDVASLEVVSEAKDYPITPKEHGVDYLMDRRHLWIRSQRQQAILRVRHEVINAVRDFFNGRGFILADTPIFTPAACEGTTTLFPVQYFEDTTAYLTQSGQLYNEANAMALGRVYAFGPTFRAEKSKTRRHLTEFWMVEPEMAYATLDDVMTLSEELVAFVVGRVLEKRKPELKALERDTAKLEKVQAPFPRISYDEAVEILHKKGHRLRVGRRLRRAGRDGALGGVRSPGLRAPLPVEGEGVLHEARSGPSGGRARRRRAGAGGLRRDHRRRRAHLAISTCSSRASRSTACRRKPSSGTSTCAATAPCRTAASAWASSGWCQLDLRAGAPARGHPVSRRDALPDRIPDL